MEIDISILGLVIAQVGRPYFEHARSHLASILQMMAVGVAGAQNLFAPVRHRPRLPARNSSALVCQWRWLNQARDSNSSKLTPICFGPPAAARRRRSLFAH